MPSLTDCSHVDECPWVTDGLPQTPNPPTPPWGFTVVIHHQFCWNILAWPLAAAGLCFQVPLLFANQQSDAATFSPSFSMPLTFAFSARSSRDLVLWVETLLADYDPLKWILSLLEFCNLVLSSNSYKNWLPTIWETSSRPFRWENDAFMNTYCTYVYNHHWTTMSQNLS